MDGRLLALLCSFAALSACEKDRISAAQGQQIAVRPTPAFSLVAVAKLEPEDGASQVEPTIKAIKVTFSEAISTESWSVVRESAESSPVVSGDPFFGDEGLSFALPVKLEPGRSYVVWLNTEGLHGFRDRRGLPLRPFRWSFSTTSAPGKVPAAANGPDEVRPVVVEVRPPAGAKDVDPSTKVLSVTFDRPMAEGGWSWVREEPAPFPRATAQPRFDPSRTTNSLEVELEPDTEYIIWINSFDHRLFQDEQGRAAVPFRWAFRTAKP